MGYNETKSETIKLSLQTAMKEEAEKQGIKKENARRELKDNDAFLKKIIIRILPNLSALSPFDRTEDLGFALDKAAGGGKIFRREISRVCKYILAPAVRENGYVYDNKTAGFISIIERNGDVDRELIANEFRRVKKTVKEARRISDTADLETVDISLYKRTISDIEKVIEGSKGLIPEPGQRVKAFISNRDTLLLEEKKEDK